MRKPKTLSLIIPVYNEAENLADFLQAVDRFNFGLRTELVDHGQAERNQQQFTCAARQLFEPKAVSHRIEHGELMIDPHHGLHVAAGGQLAKQLARQLHQPRLLLGLKPGPGIDQHLPGQRHHGKFSRSLFSIEPGGLFGRAGDISGDFMTLAIECGNEQAAFLVDDFDEFIGGQANGACDFFGLADKVDPEPWMGRRPCLPDMLPMIGQVAGRNGLWADFAHQHWGFTMGPVTGRLIAEMVTGATPFTDPYPYRTDRFQ